MNDEKPDLKVVPLKTRNFNKEFAVNRLLELIEDINTGRISGYVIAYCTQENLPGFSYVTTGFNDEVLISGIERAKINLILDTSVIEEY